MEELVDLFMENSFSVDEPVSGYIIRQLVKVDVSKLPKVKLLRFRMLLKDIIEGNQFSRVKSILTRVILVKSLI